MMQSLENRIPPPIVAALFALAMWGITSYLPAIESHAVVRVSLSLAFLAPGALFCIAGIVSFRMAKTTVNPLEPGTATSLVSSGVYKVSRNPMYLGFALVLVAWAAYLSSLWAGIGVLGFVVYMNRFQIMPEERALTGIFGSEFTRYQSKVRRWL